MAQGATLFLPQPGYNYIWGMSGDGLITNDPSLMNNLLGKESVEPAMYDCRKQ